MEFKLHQILAEKKMRRLIHHAFARVVGREPGKTTCPVSGFFPEFSLGRCLDGFALVNASCRHLPGHAFRNITILLNKNHRVRIQKRQHTDTLSAGNDPINGLPSIRERHLILAQREPLVTVDHAAGERLPWNFCQAFSLFHFCRSIRNCRVRSACCPRSEWSDSLRRLRSSGVSTSYHVGRQTTLSPLAWARRMVSESTCAVLHCIFSKSSGCGLRRPIR